MSTSSHRRPAAAPTTTTAASTFAAAAPERSGSPIRSALSIARSRLLLSPVAAMSRCSRRIRYGAVPEPLDDRHRLGRGVAEQKRAEPRTSASEDSACDGPVASGSENRRAGQIARVLIVTTGTDSRELRWPAPPPRGLTRAMGEQPEQRPDPDDREHDDEDLPSARAESARGWCCASAPQARPTGPHHAAMTPQGARDQRISSRIGSMRSPRRRERMRRRT